VILGRVISSCDPRRLGTRCNRHDPSGLRRPIGRGRGGDEPAPVCPSFGPTPGFDLVCVPELPGGANAVVERYDGDCVRCLVGELGGRVADRRCCRVVAVPESDRSASVRVPQSGRTDRGGGTFWDGATVVITDTDEANRTATTNGRLDVSSTGATIPVDGGRRRSTDHTPAPVSPRYPAAVSAGPTRDVPRTSPG
jgi:hypothetical protein